MTVVLSVSKSADKTCVIETHLVFMTNGNAFLVGVSRLRGSRSKIVWVK
jgi:hypothetical protein